MIKAIIFDCFGVLTSSRWKEFWSSLPVSEQQGARELNRQYDAGQITKEEFLSRIQNLTAHSPEEVEFVLFGHKELKNTQLIEYIRTLKNKYKLSILSNVATEWIKAELLNEQEQALFDDMVFSFEVGMTKPDARIFELAARRLKVSTNECVFIDDIDHYCQAARAVGMQAILYQNFAQMQADLKALLR